MSPARPPWELPFSFEDFHLYSSTGIYLPSKDRKKTMTATDESRVISQRPLAAVLGKFFKEIESEVYITIGDSISAQQKALNEKLEQLDDAVRTSTAKLQVKVGERTGTIEGIRHRQLEDLIAVSAQRLPVMLVGIAGSGKGGRETDRVMTPSGWRAYRDLQVGDAVIGEGGRSHQVTGVYPRGELDVYRVDFSDGSSLTVDADHLWNVRQKRASRREPKFTTVSTRELMAEGAYDKYYIPMVRPIEFEVGDELPLDPYLLGVLLGDGNMTQRSCVAFTKNDQSLVGEVKKVLPDGVSLAPSSNPNRANTYRIVGDGRRNVVLDSIKALGLHVSSGDKFVPPSYLFRTADERLALVQGLMDTDGEAGSSATFHTTAPRLVEGIRFLVESLGGTVRVAERETYVRDADGEQRPGKRSYRCTVALPIGVSPFRCDKRLMEFTPRSRYGPTRRIVGITPAGRERVICISVDNPSELYVTEHCIVTHNTHAAAQVAEALSLEFFAMSVGAQTSKSDIIGFIHAGGDYVPTLFRKAYESGGVFLMDEIDAGNANVLIQVNAALSNEYCAFPDSMVKRHPDFVFVASANTFGNGANRQYVGRNQLDAATLDRFVLIEWEVDKLLEQSLAGDSTEGRRWCEAVRRVRQKVADEGMRVLVTPRATLRGALLMEAGVSLEKAAEMSLLNLFPADKRKWARDIVMQGRKGNGKQLARIEF